MKKIIFLSLICYISLQGAEATTKPTHLEVITVFIKDKTTKASIIYKCTKPIKKPTTSEASLLIADNKNVDPLYISINSDVSLWIQQGYTCVVEK